MKFLRLLSTKYGLLLLASLLLNVGVAASIDVYEFKSDVDRIRYEQFIEEMRCPKCQNQNLSGSDSPLAGDLRREIYTQIESGRSDKEIVDFMVERYGEFVLYKPRLSSSTLFLWGFPALLLIIAIIVLIWWLVRRRATAQPTALSESEAHRLAQLMTQLDTAASSPTAKTNSQEASK